MGSKMRVHSWLPSNITQSQEGRWQIWRIFLYWWATFYGWARDWYESLQPNQQVNYQLLVQQTKYIWLCNAMKVREELFRLRMSSTTEYTGYEREFIDLWTMWIRLRGGTEDEWFKMWDNLCGDKKYSYFAVGKMFCRKERDATKGNVWFHEIARVAIEDSYYRNSTYPWVVLQLG